MVVYRHPVLFAKVNLRLSKVLEYEKMRIDDFLKIHVEQYITGRMHIVGAKEKSIAAKIIYTSTDEDQSDVNQSNDNFSSKALTPHAPMIPRISVLIKCRTHLF